MLHLGMFSVTALADVLVAFGAMIVASRVPRGSAGRATWAAAVVLTATAAIRYAFRFGLPVEGLLTVALAALTAGSLYVQRLWLRSAVVAVAGMVLIEMTVIPWTWGQESIDVFHSIQNAAAALLHWQNPYSATFTFSGVAGVPVLAPVHFQYLPGVALVAVPGRVLGDVRIMSVAASAALIVFSAMLARQACDGRPRVSRVLALSLAIPTTVAMVQWAWVDLYAVAGMAGWLALRRDHRRWSVVLLAFALATKPTILIALVPFWIWSRSVRRELLIAVASATLLTLPFVLVTGLGAFYQDVIGVQASLPFRPDGLTLNSWWHQVTGNLLPVALTVGIGALIAAGVLRKRPTDVSDLAIAAAVLTTSGFLLAKWAFLNYYFIPLWLLVLALAGSGVVLKTGDVCLPARLDVRMARWFPRHGLKQAA